jgi:regulatory protein
MLERKTLTKEQALQKLKHFCAYQERCHRDVKEKAYSLGLRKRDVEEITATLIEENYLNEERFAILFAGGKFRIKQWGRVKIKYELKQKKVSDYCIRKAMKEIGEEEYLKTLEKLAKKKWASVKCSGANYFVKMTKAREFLLQRGFEPELIQKVISGFLKNEEPASTDRI